MRHLVALGSSYASGPGIEPVEDAWAGRSSRNYAHVLAHATGARLTDLTVSGATLENVLSEPQRNGWRRFGPQVPQVPADADVVTLTGGGNDLDYVGSLMTLARWRTSATARLLRRVRLEGEPPIPEVGADAVERVADRVAAVVTAVRRRAPRARVVVVDYLTLVGPTTTPSDDLPLTPGELDRYREIAAALSAACARGAERSGALLVPAAARSAGHALGSPEPWVVGASTRAARHHAPFHPTAAGMAAVAAQVGQALEEDA